MQGDQVFHIYQDQWSSRALAKHLHVRFVLQTGLKNPIDMKWWVVSHLVTLIMVWSVVWGSLPVRLLPHILELVIYLPISQHHTRIQRDSEGSQSS